MSLFQDRMILTRSGSKDSSSYISQTFGYLAFGFADWIFFNLNKSSLPPVEIINFLLL